MKKGFISLALALTLIGVFFVCTSYFTRNLFYTIAFGAGARTLISFPVIWYLGTIEGYPRSVHYANPRPRLAFQAQTPPPNNIVFIVDESVRGDYLSVNGYEKPTTTFLDELKRKKLLKNWGVAAAGSTCSSPSNNLMLTGLADLPDHDYKVLRMPTIFQYAKAMNYKTYYIDGQISQIWNGKASDIPDFGEWITADKLNPNIKHSYEIDKEIAKKIKEITAASTGHFLWINKRGVHIPYNDSYPHSGDTTAAVGHGTTYNTALDIDVLKTDYENAIRYNSEIFFPELLSGGLAKDTFYIYTSDHGQSLRENGEIASHCSTSRSEAAVPLFIIADSRALAGVDTAYKASHSNIFPTILDLMGVPENERSYDYSLSLLKAVAEDSSRGFFSPAICPESAQAKNILLIDLWNLFPDMISKARI